jgi:hypothetical protein
MGVRDRRGHLRNWKVMITLPPNIPDDPRPAIARPMIRAVELGAAPQIADDIGWYGSAYLLTFCAFQLLFGKIYSFYNPKWVLQIADPISKMTTAVTNTHFGL